MKNQIIMLLMGVSFFFVYGQEISNLGQIEPDVQSLVKESKIVIQPDQELLLDMETLKREFGGNIFVEIVNLDGEIKVLKEGKDASIHVENTEYLIKQLLGDVYAEVGHIPESQWFEMEPIAEAYIQKFLTARAMSDGGVATQLMAEARKTFEAAIESKLTQEQKNVRAQKTGRTKNMASAS